MNEQNLIPFKKGQSGNPKGRPKGAKSMTTRLKRILNRKIKYQNPITEVEEEDKIINHLVDVLISKALSGEDKALLEILNRIDGKVKEEIEVNKNLVDLDEYSLEELQEKRKQLEEGLKKAGKKNDSA